MKSVNFICRFPFSEAVLLFTEQCKHLRKYTCTTQTNFENWLTWPAYTMQESLTDANGLQKKPSSLHKQVIFKEWCS